MMLLFLRKLKIMFNRHLMVIMEMLSKPWVLLVLHHIITLLPARNLYNTILRTQSSSFLDVPPPLIIQSSSVLAALCSFPKGTSPGNFGLHP